MERIVKRGYVFNYRLAAAKAGPFTIPAISITAEGQTIRTRPIAMNATPPQETEDFKLRVSLSDNKVYVGQPVIMTVTWYVGKNVNSFVFNLPAATDDRFDIFDPKVQARRDRHLQNALGNSQVIAEKGQGTLDGREFLTVRFSKIMVPRRPGSITFDFARLMAPAMLGSRPTKKISTGTRAIAVSR